MKMKIIKLIIGVCVIMYFMNSCTKAFIPEEEDPTTIQIEETITYEKNIQPIIQNNCLTCHGSVNPSANLTLETFTQVNNAAQSRNLIQRLNNATNPMPPSGLLPAEQRALFDKWVQDGFLKD